ncbi:hypothetical protein D9M69_628320 [compost metagenome]
MVQGTDVHRRVQLPLLDLHGKFAPAAVGEDVHPAITIAIFAASLRDHCILPARGKQQVLHEMLEILMAQAIH